MQVWYLPKGLSSHKCFANTARLISFNSAHYNRHILFQEYAFLNAFVLAFLFIFRLYFERSQSKADVIRKWYGSFKFLKKVIN